MSCPVLTTPCPFMVVSVLKSCPGRTNPAADVSSNKSIDVVKCGGLSSRFVVSFEFLDTILLS